MLGAASLALLGKFRAAPNPCVGAALVRDGSIVAQGWHAGCGKPHAEVEALEDARKRGVDPAQCSLFVTLEPCNHHGRTPPCTEAILTAGIRHVVVGARDPNPDVAGGGIDHLRSRGVQVETGVAEEACQDLVADFLVWKTTSRPYNYLKLAASLDGKIAARTGRSQWISGEQSRALVHELRSEVGAVIVGGDTFRTDDPQLTCRLDLQDQEIRQPLAVVVTSRLPAVGEQRRLLLERPGETLFWTTPEAAQSSRARALEQLGCRVWGMPPAGRGLDLAAGYERLRAECGCLYTQCEGGGRLGLSLIEAGLVDEFWLFLAPRILGDAQGISLFSGREASSMGDSLALRLAESGQLGEDLWLTLRPRRI